MNKMIVCMDSVDIGHDSNMLTQEADVWGTLGTGREHIMANLRDTCARSHTPSQ
jgi:hypothetical protein